MGKVLTVAKVLHEEAQKAPSIESVPKSDGSAAILSDPHIPWHDPAVITDLCQTSVLLGIRTLIVAGDLIHADVISKYVGVGKSVPVTDELRSCGKVLRALETIYD